MENEIEVAAFLPTQNMMLNNTAFQVGEFQGFDKVAGEPEISNACLTATDTLLFGGKECKELKT